MLFILSKKIGTDWSENLILTDIEINNSEQI